MSIWLVVLALLGVALVVSLVMFVYYVIVAVVVGIRRAVTWLRYR